MIFKRFAVLLVGLAVIVAAVGVVSDAEAQGARSIRRAIQKNVELQVRRLRMRLNIEHSAGPVRAMDISRDGRYLATVSGDDRPRLWDLPIGRETRRYAPAGGRVDEIRFAPDGGSFFGLVEGGEIVQWATGSDDRLRTIRAPGGAVRAFALSPTGSLIAVGGGDGRVHLYPVGATDATPRTIGVPGAAVAALDIGPTGEFIVVAAVDGGVRILEVNSGNTVFAADPTGVAATGIRFGRDETEYYVAAANGRLSLWSVEQNRAAALQEQGQGIVALDFRSDVQSVIAADAERKLIYWPTVTERKPISLDAHVGAVTEVRFDNERSRAFSAGEDGVVRIWDLTTGQAIASLISTERGWAVVDDKGRFDGSSRAIRNVQWIDDTHVLSLDRFTQDFYEPELLAKKRLGTLPFLTQPGYSVGTDGVLPPPTATLNILNRDQASRDGQLSIRLEVHDQGGGIDSIRLYHNGKVVDPRRVVDRQEREQDKREVVTLEYRLRAISGRNVLTAVASNSERVFGQDQTVELDVALAPRAPTLHVLAVGLNRYVEPELALNYAIPDASGLASAIEKGRGQVFGAVKLQTLFDEQATKANILAALDSLEATEPEDVVVIYYAGHGAPGGEEYFLMPHEFRMPVEEANLARYGVPSAAIRERLVRIGARRVLYLIDACKSGTAVIRYQDHKDRRAIRLLGSAVGLYVIAATANYQVAAELDKLGHGVFTYVLINGLSGKADQPPLDSTITVREITEYAEDQVPVLGEKYAQHRQFPLVFSQGLDFTLLATGTN